MNRKNHVFRVICVLIVLVMVLGACGPEATPEEVEPTEEPAATEAPQEAEPTEAPAATEAPEEVEPTEAPAAATEVWIVSSYSEGSGAQPILAELTEEYEAANPDVKINWEWAGFELYDQRIRGYIEAGTPPDAFGSAISVLIQYAKDGITQPLDEYFEQQNYEGDAKWGDSFYPALMEQNLVEDAPNGEGYYTIPTQMHTSGIFYNVNMFEEQGITPPETIQDLLAISEQLDAAGITPFAVDGGYTPYIARPFAYTASRLGGAQEYYDTVMRKEGTSWVDNPDWLAAAGITQQIFDYHQDGFLGSQWPVAQIEFAQGNMAMVIMATWLPAELQEEAPEGFEMSMFRFPAYEAGEADQTVSELNFNGYSVPEGAEHVQEVVDFLKFLSSRYATALQAERYLTPSPTVGAEMPDSLAVVKEILATSTMRPFGMGVNNDAVEWRTNVLEPLLADLALGMDPSEFIQELETQSDDFYTE